MLENSMSDGGKTQRWLTEAEPEFYKKQLGYDPYSIWVTRWRDGHVEKIPARLLAYADKEYTKVSIIYLDGSKDVVNEEQMSVRHLLEPTII